MKKLRTTLPSPILKTSFVYLSALPPLEDFDLLSLTTVTPALLSSLLVKYWVIHGDTYGFHQGIREDVAR